MKMWAFFPAHACANNVGHFCFFSVSLAFSFTAHVALFVQGFADCRFVIWGLLAFFVGTYTSEGLDYFFIFEEQAYFWLMLLEEVSYASFYAGLGGLVAFFV